MVLESDIPEMNYLTSVCNSVVFDFCEGRWEVVSWHTYKINKYGTTYTTVGKKKQTLSSVCEKHKALLVKKRLEGEI